MNKELTPMESFQEKVKSKIKENVMDALPDEVIQNLFDKSLSDLFFKRTIIEKTWNSPAVNEPSWFEKEVFKLAENKIKEQAEEWFISNNDFITKEVEKFLTPEMLNIFLMRKISSTLDYELMNRISAIESSLNSINQGY